MDGSYGSRADAASTNYRLRVQQDFRSRPRGFLLWKSGDTKASSYASNPDLITYFDSNGT